MPGLLPPFLRHLTQNDWLYYWLVRNIAFAATVKRFHNFALQVTMGVIFATLAALALSWLTRWPAGYWLVVGAAVLLFVVVDFASIFFGVTSARSQSTQVDLLRMSPLPPERFIEAVHQLAQAQAWRVLLIMQGMRFALLAALFTVGIMAVGVVVIFTFGAGALWVVILLALLLGEPVWRLQALTAIGIMAGMRMSDRGTAWGTALGLMLAAWVVQGLVALAPIFVARIFIDGGSIFFVVPLTIVLITMTWSIRTAQHWLRDVCLRRAAVALG